MKLTATPLLPAFCEDEDEGKLHQSPQGLGNGLTVSLSRPFNLSPFLTQL